MDAQVAVIVPAYNAAATIIETLSAILATTVEVEVLVVDDGSTDDTAVLVAELAEVDSRLSVIDLAHTGNPTIARMAGAQATSAPFLTFCDADDVWDRGFLEAMTAAFEHAHDAGLATSSFQTIDQAGNIIDVTSYPQWVEEPMLPRRLHLVAAAVVDGRSAVTRLCFPPPAGVVIRRSVFDAAGGFDPKVHRSEDVECWIRLARLARVVHVPEARFSYRISPGQRSQTTGRALGTIKMRTTVLFKCPTRTELRHAVHGGMAFYATLARERLRAGFRDRSFGALRSGLLDAGVVGWLLLAGLAASLQKNDTRARRSVLGNSSPH